MSEVCTLIAIPSEIIEGSTYAYLIGRNPGITHDGINKVFNDCDKDAVNPLETWVDFPPVEGEENYPDRLVSLLSPVLYANEQGRPIHIPKPIMSQLFNHPVYQAFCEEKNPIKITNINKEP